MPDPRPTTPQNGPRSKTSFTATATRPCKQPGKVDEFLESLCPLLGHLPFRLPWSPKTEPRTPRRLVVEQVKYLFFSDLGRPQLERLCHDLKSSRSVLNEDQCFKKFSTALRLVYDNVKRSRSFAGRGAAPTALRNDCAITFSAAEPFLFDTARGRPALRNSTDAGSDTEPDSPDEFCQSSIDPIIADDLDTQLVSFHADSFLQSRDPSPTPRKSRADSPQAKELSRKTSSYRVREIANDGLAPVDLPCMHGVPFHLQLELYRVMRACDFDGPRLLQDQPADKCWSWPTMYALLDHADKGNNFVKSQDVDLTNATLRASWVWRAKRTGPLLDLQLLPPVVTDDLHAFQRKFGADRFLTVDLPDFRKPAPGELRGEDFKTPFLEMLSRPHNFLGRTWQAYHAHAKDSQMTFFATSGFDLSPCSLSRLLNWLIPFDKNCHQPACKASARLDLGQSRTKPTLTFSSDQVVLVPDQLASKEPRDVRYDDPAIQWPLEKFDCTTVMSDGCCEISRMAMIKVQDVLGLDYTPSVVQARIFGSKGVWYRARGPDLEDRIHIAVSQTKIHLCKQQDSDHLTLNVVNWSRPAQPSFLYHGFLPILRDRGVPAENILAIARRQIDYEITEYIDAFNHAHDMLSWVHAQGIYERRSQRGTSTDQLTSFPDRIEERICQLLEAGFEPTRCKYLAEKVRQLGNNVFDGKEKSFKINLPQSTSVIGIADPTGVLKPGEIHLAFSKTFADSTNGSLIMLHDIPVLVARNPSMRNSDIQKVRAVYCHELSHLQDVVVFSSRGHRPLASMLSGGDYDGDTFWVCWDKDLVEPFKNAPAPLECDVRSLDYFGIVKDSTRLGDIIPANQSKDSSSLETCVRKWIDKSIKDRLTFPMLGPVTLAHTDLTYFESDISSKNAQLLVDLHDLLVDADKQGYRYGEAAWIDFKKKIGFPAIPKKPAYYRFTRPIDQPRDQPLENDHRSLFSGKRDHIIDKLYFEVIRPAITETMKRAKAVVDGATTMDAALTARWENFRASPESFVLHELGALEGAFGPLKDQWTRGHARSRAFTEQRSTSWSATVEKCRRSYLAIQPMSPDHPVVAEWLRPRGNSLSMWEELRASTFARMYHERDSMLFSIAANELCVLKAQAAPRTRQVVEDLYVHMKPRKRKRDNLSAD